MLKVGDKVRTVNPIFKNFDEIFNTVYTVIEVRGNNFVKVKSGRGWFIDKNFHFKKIGVEQIEY